MDKYHGQGGSYEVDPATRSRRLKDAPRPAEPLGGGPLDEKGRPIARPAQKVEAAMPPAPERAPWEGEAAPEPKKKGA